MYKKGYKMKKMFYHVKVEKIDQLVKGYYNLVSLLNQFENQETMVTPLYAESEEDAKKQFTYIDEQITNTKIYKHMYGEC